MKNGFSEWSGCSQIESRGCRYNSDQIIGLIGKGEKAGIQILVFPELSITGYTCGDLFHQETLLDDAKVQLGRILEETKNSSCISLIGMPLGIDNQLFNCAVAIQKGRILGVVPKTYVPNYSEFYEQRWFSSGRNALRDTIMLCGQEVPFGMICCSRTKKGKCALELRFVKICGCLFLQALFRRWPERWLFLIFLPAMKL